jgi:hypothetical protein
LGTSPITVDPSLSATKQISSGAQRREEGPTEFRERELEFDRRITVHDAVEPKPDAPSRASPTAATLARRRRRRMALQSRESYSRSLASSMTYVAQAGGAHLQEQASHGLAASAPRRSVDQGRVSGTDSDGAGCGSVRGDFRRGPRNSYSHTKDSQQRSGW